jgi:hypothetical protein
VEVAVIWSGFGHNTMKTTLLVLFVLCAAAAFGQSGPVLSNEPAITQFTQHNQHAEIHAMAIENSLVGGATATARESDHCGSSALFPSRRHWVT